MDRRNYRRKAAVGRLRRCPQGRFCFVQVRARISNSSVWYRVMRDCFLLQIDQQTSAGIRYKNPHFRPELQVDGESERLSKRHQKVRSA